MGSVTCLLDLDTFSVLDSVEVEDCQDIFWKWTVPDTLVFLLLVADSNLDTADVVVAHNVHVDTDQECKV